jgi:hypothetical protein
LSLVVVVVVLLVAVAVLVDSVLVQVYPLLPEPLIQLLLVRVEIALLVVVQRVVLVLIPYSALLLQLVAVAVGLTTRIAEMEQPEALVEAGEARVAEH